jgi:hypothetical protein
LRHIFHVLAIPEETAHDPEYQPLVPMDEPSEGFMVAPEGPLDQLSVVRPSITPLPPAWLGHAFISTIRDQPSDCFKGSPLETQKVPLVGSPGQQARVA